MSTGKTLSRGICLYTFCRGIASNRSVISRTGFGWRFRPVGKKGKIAEE